MLCAKRNLIGLKQRRKTGDKGDVELMAMLSVEDISEITSRNPKFCRIKRATFTCDFCTTSVDVCDERIATTLADSGKTPSCPICGETMRLISCDVTVRD